VFVRKFTIISNFDSSPPPPSPLFSWRGLPPDLAWPGFVGKNPKKRQNRRFEVVFMSIFT
jgi:hypothetical protein